MYAFFINTINALIRGLGEVLQFILFLLPDSPFQKFILGNDVVKKYVGFVNYFVPVAEMLLIFSAWCTAIAVYYIYQIVLRWIKMIE